MKFTGPEDEKLPKYIKSRSLIIRKKWVVIYNHFYDKKGAEAALIAANTWLKKNITKKETVAKTFSKLQSIKFEIDTSGKSLIKRADNGDEYIDFVLSDNLPDSKGMSMPIKLLKKWAEAINSGISLFGDLDHKEYDELVASGLDADEVIEQLRAGKQKSIAKSLKAILKKGKLWVRAIIDKRYKKYIKKNANGVSLEAAIITDESGNIVDGDIGGFTFAVDLPKVNPRAVIA